MIRPRRANFAKALFAVRVILLVVCGFTSGRDAGPALAEDPGPLKGTLSHSARFAQTRQADSAAAAIRAALAAQRPADAFARLQDLAAEDLAALIPDGEFWRPPAAALLRPNIAAGSTDPALARLESEAAGQLREALRSPNPAALLSIAGRYPSTAAARQIWLQQAIRDFDSGRDAAAAAGFQRIAENSQYALPTRRRAEAFALLARSAQGGESREQARRQAEQSPYLRTEAAASGSPLSSLFRHRLQSDRPPHAAVFSLPSNMNFHPDAAVPSVQPRWRYEAAMPPEMAAMLRLSLEELEGQGIHSLPASIPVVTEDTAAARILDEILAFDLHTGDVRWRRTTGAAWKQLSGNLKMLQNDGLADMISRRLLYRLQADSLYSRLSSDGRSLFAAIEPEEVSLISQSPGAGPRSGPAATAATAFNLLVAWDIVTGEERWRIGGPLAKPPETATPTEDASDWRRGVLFLGPPLPLDRQVFAVGAKNSQLRLYAMDAADGELQWQLDLALVSEEPPTSDVRPLPPACPIAHHEGILVCATSAGGLVAVDLFQRSILWAWRYPRTDIGSLNPGGQSQWSRQLLYPWWSMWRETTLHIAGNAVFFSGPDTRFLHALDLRAGKRLWSQPQGDWRQLVGFNGADLLVASHRQLHSLDPRTGGTRWSAAVGPLLGRPSLGKSHVVVPLQDGRVVQLALSDGRVLHPGSPGKEPLGNLVAFPRGWLAQHGHRLVRLDLLGDRLARLAKDDPPADAAALLQRGRLLLEAGRFEEAIALGEKLATPQSNPDSTSLLQDAAVAAVAANPSFGESLWPRLEPLLSTPSDRIALLEALGQAAAASGHPRDALAHWLRALELNPSNPSAPERAHTLPLDAATHRAPSRVLPNRRIQGRLLDLLDHASPESHDELAADIGRRLDDAIASADPFALQRFADHLGELPWGRLVRIREPAKVGLGAPFLKTQLSLLDLSRNPDRSLAASALHQFARTLESRGWRADAALAHRRLKTDYADTIAEDGQTGRALAARIADDSLLGQLIAQGTASPWPAGVPTVSRQADMGKDCEMQPIPIEADSHSLLDRITVSIDRNGRRIRFQGGQQRAAWDVALPDSKAMFRTAQPLHKGWAWGHLLILRVGAELFGILPLDERGDPNATVAWRLDMLDGQAPRWNQLGVRLDPTPPGFGLDDVVLVDRFGRNLGQVGPVLPGYLCYRDQARLIAVDTATGARLWERGDIPADAVVAGNTEQILIGLPGEPRVRKIRAFDGSLLGEHAVPLPVDRVLQWSGSHALALARDDRSYLVFLDFADGRTLWERPILAAAKPFTIDDQTVGVLDPDGQLHLIDLFTGDTRNTARIDVPSRIERVYSTRDEERCFLGIAGPPANVDHQRLQQERGGFRSPPVNGVLASIDRRSARLEWTAPLVDASLPHEQPRECPFLFLQFLRKGEGEAAPCLMRLIDKRTGATLQEWSRDHFLAEHVIEPNVEQKRIELRQPGLTLRLQYDAP